MMNNGGKVCAVRICDPKRLRPESGVGVLGVVSGGEMTLVRGDSVRILGEKEAFFLFGGSGWELSATHGCADALYISCDIVKDIFGGSVLCEPVLGTLKEIAAEVVEEAKRALIEKKFGYEAAAENVVRGFLLRLCREREVFVPRSEYNDETDRFFGGLLAEIVKNYADLTFDDAARFMRLSRAYFSSVFRKHVGTTFSQYLNYVRVRSAINMLRGGGKKSVTDVSLRCGFGTIRNFNRAFREITGYSPRTLPADYELTALV